MRAIAVKEFRELRVTAAPSRCSSPGGDVATVCAALDAAGVQATLDLVPASFEETFVRLALAGPDAVRVRPERTPR